MKKAYKLPLELIFGTVLALSVGELLEGTAVYFVCMMAITLVAIGITYNLLGGLRSISGFMFADLALFTIVLSQFAKVLLGERADSNLEVPYLTIKIYAVFYVSLMLAVFLYGRIRLALPKPMEPPTLSHSRRLYFISLILGTLANVIFAVTTAGGGAAKDGLEHSFALAFSGLILFSLVLAVENQIVATQGQHSLGFWVILPMIISACLSTLSGARGGIALPVVVYFVTCFLRGYRFKRRHYFAMVASILLFQFLISPFEVFMKGQVGNLSIRERIEKNLDAVVHGPGWATIELSQKEVETRAAGEDEYYSHSGTFVLSRLSLIRADSHLIDACSTGYHYGYRYLLPNLLTQVPRILYPDKPDPTGADDLQSVTGTDSSDATYWDQSCISDAFGAFGWLGVVVFPMTVLPMLFIVYDSMFDISRPWGTVTLGMIATRFSGYNMSGMITFLVKEPIFIFMLSLLVGYVVHYLGNASDESFRRRGTIFGLKMVDASATETSADHGIR